MAASGIWPRRRSKTYSNLCNANGSVPRWVLEQPKKARINGIKWGSSIPPNANPAVVAKCKMSIMIRLKVVELISSVEVGVKVKCTEVNRHDATVNSIPQGEVMQLCLWDVAEMPKINMKKELKVGPPIFFRPVTAPSHLFLLAPYFTPPRANDDSKLHHWICYKVVCVRAPFVSSHDFVFVARAHRWRKKHGPPLATSTQSRAQSRTCTRRGNAPK
jgi:hypothetical protein